MGWPHSLNLRPSEARHFYAVYLVAVLPAAAIVLLSHDLADLAVGAMVFNVVVLALPLAFLIRLTSDRELLGPLANSRRYAAVLWVLAAALLIAGTYGMVQFLALG